MDFIESTIIANNVLLGHTAEGDRVFVTVETTEMHGNSITTIHDPISRWTRISITGEVIEKGRRIATSGGQIVDDLVFIETFAPGWDTAKVTRLRILWQDHHLNDMRAGCVHQSPVGTTTSEMLDNTPVCPETGYKWGSAWLVDPEAETQVAIMRLQALFSDRWED